MFVFRWPADDVNALAVVVLLEALLLANAPAMGVFS